MLSGVPAHASAASLMGVLGAARVPWGTWFRWAWKLILLLHAIAALFLMAAIYGPAAWLR